MVLLLSRLQAAPAHHPKERSPAAVTSSRRQPSVLPARMASSAVRGFLPPPKARHPTPSPGVVWFRADPSAIEFAREWALGTLALTDPFSDDQGVFNRLLLRGMFPVEAHSDDGRVIRARGSLRVAPLPAARFCSGHLMWVQQAAQPRQCLSVHATFTEYGDAGKRWRFLEANPSPSPNPDPPH